MPLTAVLLDLDGTLVDTNRFHTEAYRRTLDAFDYDVETDAIARQVGKGGDKLVPALIGEEGEEKDGEALRERAGKEFTDVLAKENTFELFDDVLELIAALQERGLKTAIATSSEDDFLDAIFGSVGTDLRERVDAVTTASDVDASKPEADVVHAALDALDVDAEEAVLIGDTIYDLEAASRAGVAALGVATWVWSQEELEDAGARAAFADVADLLAHLDEALAAADRP